ncbi:RNA pyrophosphohydrolase [Candidatus Falkowbacteria bacterium CG10_big_fil_rev_8_21_14_0_10_39_11]|uniref:RNA pyrophosphohydrolase n=1 Tax=Candidatus Falkowbacteria bacterium CG10_big_fil_rev_8_21_14_0_10_39_11 TaxID=1974565 RepID=A0A2H0V8C7_9BACT|nr:MAG: RNA pyrophosphohydrolase [Candidatus Falkowbacteria bacterium CG10_big_fil_rev_8_21_14_0_10_39_11]
MIKKYRPNVLAVVTKDDKILIQHNPRFDHWQLPQGGIDAGETAEQAVIREASEELGVDAKFLSIKHQLEQTHRYDWPDHTLKKDYYKKEGYIGQEQTIFILNFNGTDSDFHLEKSHEADQIKWVNKDELKKVIHPRRHGSLDIILKHI